MNFYLLVWLCFSAGARLFVRCVEKVLALAAIAWSCDFPKYFIAGIYLLSTVTESSSDDWHQQKESKKRAASSKQRNKINYISFSSGGMRRKIFIVDKDFERLNSNFIYHQRRRIQTRNWKSEAGEKRKREKPIWNVFSPLNCALVRWCFAIDVSFMYYSFCHPMFSRLPNINFNERFKDLRILSPLASVES